MEFHGLSDQYLYPSKVIFTDETYGFVVFCLLNADARILVQGEAGGIE